MMAVRSVCPWVECSGEGVHETAVVIVALCQHCCLLCVNCRDGISHFC